MTNSAGTAAKTHASRRAILIMCAGVLFLVLNDAIAKWLVTRYAPLQILFIRSVLALPMIAWLVCLVDGREALRSARPRVHAFRGVLAVAGTYAFILSLDTLSLAEATSLIFTAPIFVAALSLPLLREHVGWRRGAMIVAGFFGVLIVVRPVATTLQPAALLAVTAALLNALVMISARWIDARDSIWTMMFQMTVFSSVFSAFVVVTSWPAPRFEDLALFFGMAVCGTLGVTLISQAFRMSPATVVAPFDYTALIWASLLGWLVWGNVPEIWTYVGASVIIGSGLLLIFADAHGQA